MRLRGVQPAAGWLAGASLPYSHGSTNQGTSTQKPPHFCAPLCSCPGADAVNSGCTARPLPSPSHGGSRQRTVRHVGEAHAPAVDAGVVYQQLAARGIGEQ